VLALKGALSGMSRAESRLREVPDVLSLDSTLSVRGSQPRAPDVLALDDAHSGRDRAGSRA